MNHIKERNRSSANQKKSFALKSFNDSLIRSPLVKLVHYLEVHVGCPEHVFVDEVEGGVGDELVQVPVGKEGGVEVGFTT